MNRSRFTPLAILLLSAVAAQAEIKPHALFSDHMVLQRDQPLHFWGTANPNEEVYVHLTITTVDGKREEGTAVKADKDGLFKAKLSKFPAGTAGQLTFRGEDKFAAKGKPNAVVLKDVLVGEVWICSGQSNMEWSLAATPKAGGPEVIKNSTNPNLRLFSVPKYAVPTPQAGLNPKPPTALHSKWNLCTPDTSPMFSAVAYFFGKDLQKALDVPVGLIHTSWGGTPAQAWTSPEALNAESSLKYYHTELAERAKTYDPEKAKAAYDAAMVKWKAAAAAAKDGGKTPPAQPRLQLQPGFGQNDPSTLYNGMIAPLIPYTIRGAIWYQGESNAGKPIEYRTLFATMISDWRKRWGYDFPFYCVQLAPFKAGNAEADNWAYLREAQAIACAKVKNAGVAVITDAGDLDDIHPQKKEPCGVRMSLLARAHIFGEKVEYSGPAFKTLKVDGSKAIVTFDHTAGGLSAGSFEMAGAGKVGADGQLSGFTVCGEDKVFHPAKAIIEGDAVILSSEKVSKPVAVRYGWKNFPTVNLFNKVGLPASPFRTDDFPYPAK